MGTVSFVRVVTVYSIMLLGLDRWSFPSAFRVPPKLFPYCHGYDFEPSNWYLFLYVDSSNSCTK